MEALNFFNLGAYYTFYNVYLMVYMVTTVFTVADYHRQCREKHAEDFEKKCSYVPAIGRVIVVFVMLPLQIFVVESMKRFQGLRLSWFSIIKILCHLTTVVTLIESESAMITSMDIPQNFNIALVLLDLLYLAIVDIPEIPYPLNLVVVLIDGLYISLKFQSIGANSYQTYKSILLALLCVWYMNKRKNHDFNIQKMMYSEIR